MHEANERSLEALASAAVEEQEEGDDDLASSHNSQEDEVHTLVPLLDLTCPSVFRATTGQQIANPSFHCTIRLTP